jgi:hypothetical protein
MGNPENAAVFVRWSLYRNKNNCEFLIFVQQYAGLAERRAPALNGVSVNFIDSEFRVAVTSTRLQLCAFGPDDVCVCSRRAKVPFIPFTSGRHATFCLQCG